MKNDRSAQELISRSLDEDLSTAESIRLRALLEEHPELENLAEDLALLKALAPEVDPPGPAPSGQKLKTLVERRYAAPAGGKRPAMVYWALAALVLVSIMLLPLMKRGFGDHPSVENPILAETPSDPNAHAPPLALIQAQLQFHRQAALLENLVLLRLTQSRNPGAVTWARDFYRLNLTIARMEELCRDYPARPGHYAALSRVYHAKIDLLAAYLTVSEELG